MQSPPRTAVTPNIAQVLKVFQAAEALVSKCESQLLAPTSKLNT